MDNFNFYTDFYTDYPLDYYYGVDVDINPDEKMVPVLAKETQYKVKVGRMDEVVNVDPVIEKEADGTPFIKTIVNTDALNIVGSRYKASWWKTHSP